MPVRFRRYSSGTTLPPWDNSRRSDAHHPPPPLTMTRSASPISLAQMRVVPELARCWSLREYFVHIGTNSTFGLPSSMAKRRKSNGLKEVAFGGPPQTTRSTTLLVRHLRSPGNRVQATSTVLALLRTDSKLASISDSAHQMWNQLRSKHLGRPDKCNAGDLLPFPPFEYLLPFNRSWP